LTAANDTRAPQRPPRRTQEERSAATRARVIAAATACIAERGFKDATMSAIAARAGVTWGAMQHQFGGKEAILDAVLEGCLAGLEAWMAELRGRQPDDVRRRVGAFVGEAGEWLRGPSYLAFIEIQLHRSRLEARDEASELIWSERVAGLLDRAWKSCFEDCGVPPRELRRAQRFSFMLLSGIAVEAALFPDADHSAQHLALLEANLIELLRPA